jgi:hypothetical protein
MHIKMQPQPIAVGITQTQQFLLDITPNPVTTRNYDTGGNNIRGISRREATKRGTAAIRLPLVARAAGPGGRNNVGRELIPFTIVTNSGSAQPVYLYLFGNTVPAGAGRETRRALKECSGFCS